MKIAIYTAVFGGYDPIKPQVKQNLSADFFYFTDQEITHPDWKVIIVPAEADSRRQAKFYKLLPHKIPELEGYDLTIWIDGSYTLKRPDFAEWVISFISESGWSIFPHTEFKNLYEEADEMAKVKKYQHMPITEQAEYYKSQGCPEDSGLFYGSMIARDMHNLQWQKISEAWWQENIKWTLRDQISLPYVLWKEQGKIDIMDADLYHNDYFIIDNGYRAHEYEAR
jgi:hypothetical protein